MARVKVPSVQADLIAQAPGPKAGKMRGGMGLVSLKEFQ
jgi:hypothetical protein